MKSKSLLMFFVLIVVILLTGAGLFIYTNMSTNKNPNKVGDTELIGKRWNLESLNGQPVTSGIYIEFTKEANVNGFGGCNSFSGNFTLQNSIVTFGPLASTKISCGTEADALESDILQKLPIANDVSLANGKLTLADPAATFVFTEGTTATTNTNLLAKWNFVKEVTTEQETLLVEGTTATIEFNQDGSVTGEVCNSFGGKYVVNGQNLSITELITTEKACTEPVGIMEQENMLYQNLGEATKFEVSGNTLKVFFSEAEYLEFSKSS